MTVVSIGTARATGLARTVEIGSPAVLLTCGEEVARVESSTGIRPAGPGDFELSMDALAAMEAQISLGCPGFDVALKRTRIAFSRGNIRFLEFPPAWALVQLGKAVDAGRLSMSGADGVALTYLRLMLHLLDRWSHHERFPSIQASLLSEFHHSVAQLIAASYLADVGNAIGFAQPRKGGGRSPDMFINLDAETRLGVEVKAPAELQWPNDSPTAERLERIVKDRLKDARGQIAGPAGGVLVIGASIAAPEFHSACSQVVAEMANGGRISSRVSAVAVVSLAPHPTASDGVGGIRIDNAAKIRAIPNPRYTGPGRVAVEPSEATRNSVISMA